MTKAAFAGTNATRPVRVLAIVPGFIPSAIIQIVRPFLALHRAGQIVARIRCETRVSAPDVHHADVVVLCRLLEPKHGWLLDLLQQTAKPYIYDLDDDLFHVPDTDPSSRYHNTPERLEQLTAYITQASLVRVYAEPLRQSLMSLNPNVLQATTAFDFSLLPAKHQERKGRTIKIVYATSRQQDSLGHLFEEGLRCVLDQAAGRVTLYCWGSVPSTLRSHPHVRFLPLIRDYESYIRRFAELRFDIGLAPMLDTPFYNCKTNNKLREYGACRCAGVYSNTPLYAAYVTHGETGLLVDNEPEAWKQAVWQLCEDESLRRRIQEKAHAFVQARHAQPIAEAEWLEHFARVLNQVPRATTYPLRPFTSAATMPDSGGLSQRVIRLVNGATRSLRTHGWRQTFAAAENYLWQRRYQAYLDWVTQSKTA